eukprot:3190783-Pleurochrysis_carterae.AAC.1
MNLTLTHVIHNVPRPRDPGSRSARNTARVQRCCIVATASLHRCDDSKEAPRSTRSSARKLSQTI